MTDRSTAHVTVAATCAVLALVLAACSPQVDTDAEAPTRSPAMTAAPVKPTPEPPAVETELQVDPEAWEPLGNLLVATKPLLGSDTELRSLVPGATETVTTVSELFGNEEVKHTRWAAIGDTAPQLAVVALIRTPAKGITPPSFRVDVVAVPAGASEPAPYTVVDGLSEKAEVRSAVGSPAGVVAVEVSDTDEAKDDVVSITYAVDALTGKEVWQQEGYVAGPVFGALTVETWPEDGPCRTLTMRDVGTGKELRRFVGADMPGDGSEPCADPQILRYKSGTVYEREAVGDAVVMVRRTFSDRGLWFDARTGAELAFPHRNLAFFDPVHNLALVDDRLSRPLGDQSPKPVEVYDAITGEVKFTMAEETAKELGFIPRALFDGVLYGETSDAHVEIRVADGVVTDDASGVTPVAAVGDWTYFSDGSLTRR